ncbi:hypothetical protein Tco_1031708 [Tanacetum coccineum]|uniref:Uncharacterized protein n=1 Tax=Tanacetum coccineum TaxID=301880 RepID=A0ABQ5G9S5_9ASTR
MIGNSKGHLQKEDQGYVDSRCSRHMTGNMSYLSDFKEFDGGYVTFRGGAKGGKITSKRTLKTGVTKVWDAEAEDDDVHLYRSMIGSLMYLTSSRPDIMFAICACARFQYPKDTPFELEAYSDSDYAGASLDRKSTTGGCQFLGSRLISWQIVDFLNASPISSKSTAWNEFGTNIASAVICLAKKQKFHISKLIFDDETDDEERGDNVERAATTATSLDAEQCSGSPRRQDTMGDRPAQTRVLNLGNIKDAQALEIKKLKKRVKKLEKDSETQGRYGHDIRVNTTSTSITTASINITTVEPVTTASAPVTTTGVSVGTAEPSTPPPPTTTIIPIKDEDLTIAQTFMKMKSEKSKGKAKMVEPEKLKKKKDQIKYDANVAQRLQAELDEEARLEREREEEAKEQGEISIEERSKLFVELRNERKKHFARLRAEEQRRKPPTKTQKRNLMSTYLKNMVGYKHTQLKNKSFKEIQMLFEKEMKRLNMFVDMDAELVKGSETIKSEVDRAVPELAAGSSKRDAEEELDQESSKRQKTGESSARTS